LISLLQRRYQNSSVALQADRDMQRIPRPNRGRFEKGMA
jgi:hypothetical protein